MKEEDQQEVASQGASLDIIQERHHVLVFAFSSDTCDCAKRKVKSAKDHVSWCRRSIRCPLRHALQLLALPDSEVHLNLISISDIIWQLTNLQGRLRLCWRYRQRLWVLIHRVSIVGALANAGSLHFFRVSAHMSDA